MQKKMVQKRGRYSTCITKKIELNENKSIEVIHAAMKTYEYS